MTESISPFIRRCAALSLLAFAVWLVANSAFGLISNRIAIGRELTSLNSRYDALRARRIDIPSLKRQLQQLESSRRIQHSVIIAKTAKAAQGILQQSVRRDVRKAAATLSLLSDGVNPPDASTVSVRVRASIQEAQLPMLIRAFERSSPKLTISSLLLANRSSGRKGATSIDVTAELYASWLHAEKSRR